MDRAIHEFSMVHELISRAQQFSTPSVFMTNWQTGVVLGLERTIIDVFSCTLISFVPSPIITRYLHLTPYMNQTAIGVILREANDFFKWIRVLQQDKLILYQLASHPTFVRNEFHSPYLKHVLWHRSGFIYMSEKDTDELWFNHAVYSRYVDERIWTALETSHFCNQVRVQTSQPDRVIGIQFATTEISKNVQLGVILTPVYRSMWGLEWWRSFRWHTWIRFKLWGSGRILKYRRKHKGWDAITVWFSWVMLFSKSRLFAGLACTMEVLEEFH